MNISRPAVYAGALLAFTMTHAALAADNGFYLGAGLGQANTKIDEAPLSLDDHHSAYKLIAGFRALDLLAVEANYVDFGKVGEATQTAHPRAVGVFAIGYLPIPIVDVYGKVGYANWKLRPEISAADFKDNGSDFAFGGGLQLHWGSLAARVEYEKYQAKSADDLSLVSAGLTWTF